ncbi:serine/threonine-protein kinase [Streptomyces sp. NRRL WC-3742]|uniref:serine/threonine-protein kinase n=1 Tax=Streptomyces sp. NRRL WC-3742 TaxID=1463934 RepID=UPI0004C6F34E|nr:serine/threonine-protein kinase [Streptomyces sp. NRRL WC-3742]
MNTGGPGVSLIDGRFELLERLGGGGMGLVWRARDTALHREVALKEVRPPDPALLDGDPRAAQVVRERVLREARSLARLNHPNVVTIHHIVDLPQLPHPWLVMELVTGGSLHDRLTRGPMSPPEAARLGRGVLAALSAAHAAGIQHRDVKPGNVLLRPDGTPVLTDFGIAGLAEAPSLTTTGSLIGSPEYIAPERVRGEEGNPASDLWSLGMMLYVAVEGHHPLRRGTSLATLAAVLDDPVPPPVRSGALAPALSALLVRNTAARPDAALLDRMLAAAEGYGPGAAFAPAAPSTPDTVRLYPPTDAGTSPHTLADEPTPEPAPEPAPEPPRPVRRRIALRSGSALLLAAAMLTIGLTVQHFAAQQGNRAAEPPAYPGLLTPSGVRDVIQSMSPSMRGTTALEFTVQQDYGYATVPTAANPSLYDSFEYRNGRTSPGNRSGTVAFREKPVDLKSVNWDALPALLQRADSDLGIAKPTSHYIIVRNAPGMADAGPTLLVYVTDSYGGAYLVSDLNGNVTKTYPRNK